MTIAVASPFFERPNMVCADMSRESKPLVQIKDVGKRYPHGTNDLEALRDVNLTINGDEFVSILGPSGCGKSTLLMVIGGFVPPSEGKVVVDGAAVTSPISDVGIVFQRDLLFDWRTVLGNVLLQADIRRNMDRAMAREKALELLARTGLSGFENHYPWQLSGGMRQRVSICRALLHDSKLLLMDEPFGALDALTRDQMAMDLQRLWMAKRRTVVFVTHSIPEAVFLSDRVVVMSARPGRIVMELVVDLPRPRTLDVYENKKFIEYQQEIRRKFETLDLPK